MVSGSVGMSVRLVSKDEGWQRNVLIVYSSTRGDGLSLKENRMHRREVTVTEAGWRHEDGKRRKSVVREREKKRYRYPGRLP